MHGQQNIKKKRVSMFPCHSNNKHRLFNCTALKALTDWS